MVKSVETVAVEELMSYADFDNRGLAGATGRGDISQLPVIDFSAYATNGDEAAKTKVADQMRQASLDIGFFYLTNHGIPVADLDKLLQVGRDYFHLPLADKKKAVSTTATGYFSGQEASKTGDHKERLRFLHEFALDASELDKHPRGKYSWPEDALVPGLRSFVEDNFMYASVALTQRIAAALARSLGLDEGYFARTNGRYGAAMVYNYYPSLDPESLAASQWSSSPHCDFGAFTILVMDDVPALQVKNSANRWVDAPPLPGALLVNIGNLLQRQTNDLYKSSLHRVANVSGKERISASFFAGPPPNAQIHCIETCTNANNPPRYPPIEWGTYHAALVEQINASGRIAVPVEHAKRYEG